MSNFEAKDSRLNLLAFSGSTRVGSWNAELLSQVSSHVQHFNEDVDVDLINLDDFDMPIYNADKEIAEGLPDTVHRLQNLIHQSDGLIIACPEYNGSVTSLLKNSIDWCSRPSRPEYKPSVFWTKPVLIVGASISPFGAVRATNHLRGILGKLGAFVSPGELLVPYAQKALSDSTSMDSATHAALSSACSVFLNITRQCALSTGDESI